MARPAIAFVAAFLGFLHPLAGQTGSGPRLGLAAGLEIHGPWTGSPLGPTAAISLSTPLTNRVHIQGVLAGSSRIKIGGEDVTICPLTTGCVADRSDPSTTLGATVELVVYDHPGDRGGYVLGGVGLVRYAGLGLKGAPVRAQVDAGVGGVFGNGRSQVFIEARLARALNAGPYPKWFAPIRLGWRTRI